MRWSRKPVSRASRSGATSRLLTSSVFWAVMENWNRLREKDLVGEPWGNRTLNLLIKSQLLYRLS